MAIKTRRRARFRRATSGSQNLTTLIYNILKEQQAARKSAILAAFNANMASKTYDSTYGGEPVDSAAVEAFYASMIAAYPEGTTERDRLMAELSEFKTTSLRQEMNAYAEAYENGTYAFGTKITMNDYLSFLREAKASTGSAADKMLYTKEEFLVTFNDISSDMKAKGAGAGAFVKFYERQLKRAEEMGITKDSKTYRDIQGYLADASKTAAAEFKQKQLQDAIDLVSRRTTKLASSLIASATAAAAAGRINQDDLIAIRGNGDPMGIVSRWLSMGLGDKSAIINAGNEAGVMLGQDAFTADAILDWVEKTRSGIVTISKSSLADADTKSRMMLYLDQYDAEISGPMGLLTDLSSAERSSMNLTLDNEKAFGNPMVNIDLYVRHANNIQETVGQDMMGRAFQDILRGFVPDGGKDFLDDAGNRITRIVDLNQAQIDRLKATYTGTAFVFTGGDIDPDTFLDKVISDYRSADLVATGNGYLEAVPYGDNGVEIVVRDKPIDGIVTLSSSSLTEGGNWTALAKQEKKPVLTSEGNLLGHKFFEIDDKGQRVEKFLTLDGYTMDMSKYLRYLDGIGGTSYDAENGGLTVTGLAPEIVARASTGDLIRNNSSYGQFVSQNKFNNIAKGPGYADAVKNVASDIFTNLSATGAIPSVFSLDSEGNLVVRDEEAAFRTTGLLAGDLLDIFNAEGNSGVRRQVELTTLMRDRGVDGGGLDRSGTIETFATPDGGTSLTPTPEQSSARMDRGYVAASDMLERVQANTRFRQFMDEAQKPQNVFFAAGLGSSGFIPPIPRAANDQKNTFASQAAAASSRLRLPSELAASPFTGPAARAAQPAPAFDGNFAFRYASGYSPQAPAASPTSTVGFSGTTLNPGMSTTTPVIKPIQFTPQQISQSLVDFRAGERNME